MPITLPAHAAAVLPFFRARRVLSPLALVVGACAPDFGYLVAIQSLRSHTFKGLFTFCLPVGWAMYLWSCVLVLPVLKHASGNALGIDWGRVLDPEPPRGLAATPSLLIGAATHLIWDGFTHRFMWPAVALYGDLRVNAFLITRALQHLSTLIGTTIVFLWLRRNFPAQGTPTPRFRLWLGWMTVVFAVASLVSTLLTRRILPSVEGAAWSLFWPTLSGALLGLTLACLAVRRRA
ncbi:MAG: DUF4184 family protein [Myxococcaceae bacterium]